MEFKGTKGKWVLKQIPTYDSFGTVSIGTDELEYKTKSVTNEEQIKKETADLLLISKAPEMLEMLKRFVESDDLQIEDFIEASQLIKEASQLIKEATEL